MRLDAWFSSVHSIEAHFKIEYLLKVSLILKDNREHWTGLLPHEPTLESL